MTGCLRQEKSLSVVIIKKVCIKGNSTRAPWVGIEMVEKNLVRIARKGGRERDRWRRVSRTGAVHYMFKTKTLV